MLPPPPPFQPQQQQQQPAPRFPPAATPGAFARGSLPPEAALAQDSYIDAVAGALRRTQAIQRKVEALESRLQPLQTPVAAYRSRPAETPAAAQQDQQHHQQQPETPRSAAPGGMLRSGAPPQSALRDGAPGGGAGARPGPVLGSFPSALGGAQLMPPASRAPTAAPQQPPAAGGAGGGSSRFPQQQQPAAPAAAGGGAASRIDYYGLFDGAGEKSYLT